MDETKLSKYERTLAGLQGGNALATKATTIENVNFAGEASTYIVQTVRAEYKVGDKTKTGDFIVIKYIDNDGTIRIILPPKVSATIDRQRVAVEKRAQAVSKKARSAAAKVAMQERMAAGWKPTFSKKAESYSESNGAMLPAKAKEDA